MTAVRDNEVEPLTDREQVLIAALWKLQRNAAQRITDADMDLCRNAFAPDQRCLLILDTPDGVEVRITSSRQEARRLRAYSDAMVGHA
jgi:hypothetical protein